MTDHASEALAVAEPATAPAAIPRNTRRRTLLILASISIGWKAIVFTLGAAIPRWLIEDGIADLTPAYRAYGADARRTARALYDGPIERYGLVRTVRVLSVEQLPPAADAARCGGLGARVRAYTYFAIPYSEVRTVCDRGVVEYRVFRRSHRGG
jgi:hypothetical protein